MKTVITYGTFDLFHTGHLNLLKRARELGERLIVGVTSDAYNQARGKLNVVQSCAERIENVRRTGIADLIIIEEEENQKIRDICTFEASIFVMGSDWVGKFDYLSEYCKVIYLERTKGSASATPENIHVPIIHIGIIGHGRIAERFIVESKYVSGIEVTAIYGRSKARVTAFTKQHEVECAYNNLDDFLRAVDAVYIAVPHHLHVSFAKKAIQCGKHVLCEKPLALTKRDSEELYERARHNNCILMEAIKTAYAPAFKKLLTILQGGKLGDIRSVDASFTKLIKNKSLREYDAEQAGGALTELGSYPLFVIAKLLGVNPTQITFTTLYNSEKQVDIFTRVSLVYPRAMATATVGIGVKREGDLCIGCTNGYIYVPAPWWKTEHFEIRYENPDLNEVYHVPFAEDGLRYELSSFLNQIQYRTQESHHVTQEESTFMAGILEQFRKGEQTTHLH